MNSKKEEDRTDYTSPYPLNQGNTSSLCTWWGCPGKHPRGVQIFFLPRGREKELARGRTLLVWRQELIKARQFIEQSSREEEPEDSKMLSLEEKPQKPSACVLWMGPVATLPRRWR